MPSYYKQRLYCLRLIESWSFENWSAMQAAVVAPTVVRTLKDNSHNLRTSSFSLNAVAGRIYSNQWRIFVPLQFHMKARDFSKSEGNYWFLKVWQLIKSYWKWIKSKQFFIKKNLIILIQRMIFWARNTNWAYWAKSKNFKKWNNVSSD